MRGIVACRACIPLNERQKVSQHADRCLTQATLTPHFTTHTQVEARGESRVTQSQSPHLKFFNYFYREIVTYLSTSDSRLRSMPTAVCRRPLATLHTQQENRNLSCLHTSQRATAGFAACRPLSDAGHSPRGRA
jgi:hypothetical protein